MPELLTSIQFERKKKALNDKITKFRTKKDRPPNRKNNKRTRPERLMIWFLREMHIDFEVEFPVYFAHEWRIFDMYLPEYNVLIEVDGDHWHTNPETQKMQYRYQMSNKKNDAFKNFIAKNKGYRLLRFWENDIVNRSEDVKERLIKEITEK